MRKEWSLKKLIAISISLTIICIALIYTGLIYMTIHSAENQLMGSAMSSTLNGIMTYDISQGQHPRLDQFSRLYIEDDPVRPIPEAFKDLPLGYVEVVKGEDLHVYSMLYNGKRVVLTRNQELFESWEIKVFIGILVFFAALVCFSFFFAHWLSKRLLKPLDRLTLKAAEADKALQNGQIYSTDLFKEKSWSNNEIGRLAKTLNNLTSKIRNLAVKEKIFSGEVSHEIRTPLTVINTSLELLETDPGTSPSQRKFINRALKASQRIKELTEVFLNLSRGTRNEDTHQVTVSEFFQDHQQEWQTKFAAKGLDFNVKVFSNSQDTYNEVLVGATFDNLLNNALKFTDKGGVTISINTDCVVIEDTGCGIKEEYREKIFDSGYQAKPDDKLGGFGLGLAIARRAADYLGWTIKLKDSGEEGSTFVISFNKK